MHAPVVAREIIKKAWEVADRTFEVLLRTPTGQGADLGSVVEKLRAINRIYEAIYTSRVRPGSSRISIPAEIAPFTKVRLIGASRSSSLGLEIEEPSPPPLTYDGDYETLPAQGPIVFRSMLRAVSKHAADDLAALFPEKADRVRVLTGLEELAPTPAEPSVVLRGLDGLDDLTLRPADREWFLQTLPSLAPEKKNIAGMIRAGTLGAAPRFKLYDGARVVRLRPPIDLLPTLQKEFGNVVKLSGVVHYTAAGGVSYMNEIESIEPYEHVVDHVATNTHEFVFNYPLKFTVDASLGPGGFALSNEHLDIHVYGRSLKEAFDLVGEHIEFLWDEYANADDAELHETGIQLKKKVRALIREASEVHG